MDQFIGPSASCLNKKSKSKMITDFSERSVVGRGRLLVNCPRTNLCMDHLVTRRVSFYKTAVNPNSFGNLV